MKPHAIEKALQYLGVSVPTAQKRRGWTVSPCPMAPWMHDGGIDKNPSFAVKHEKGDPLTNCFSCGWHGTLRDLVIEINYRNKKSPMPGIEIGKANDLIDDAENKEYLDIETPSLEELLLGKRKRMKEFPDWWLSSFAPWHDVDFAVKYVTERDVPAHVCDILDIRADTKEQRVCFPVRDFHGVCRGLHGRAILKGVEPRYRMYPYQDETNPLVWLGESWVDLSKPIVVVEGPFDLASVLRVYPNAVSPLFANPSNEKIMRMSDCFEWITFLDTGKAGDHGRHKLEKVLGKDHLIKHVQPPPGVKDPGAMTVQQLLDVLSPVLRLKTG